VKKLLLLVLVQLAFVPVALARDSVDRYSVAEALSLEEAKEALGSTISFYFGNQAHGNVVENFGEFKTNKKTSTFGRTDKQACQRAFLSAMISLKERTIKEGGNAVINIKSNHKNNLTSLDDKFECGAGNVVASVVLVGKVVTIDITPN